MVDTATVEWMRLAPEIALRWILVLTLVGFALTFFMRVWNGGIDMSGLISEPDPTGKASLSRFQLLLSTFVIVGCYLAITLTSPPENGVLYEIPPGLLGFFGISGASFLVSKSISSNTPSTQSTSADADGKAADTKTNTGTNQKDEKP